MQCVSEYNAYAAPIAPFDFNNIRTLFTFGDSYTTQNLNTQTLSYACPNCTSAGGPNWVEYLVRLHPMQYWNLAYNSAPIENALVGQPQSLVADVTMQVLDMFPALFLNTAYGAARGVQPWQPSSTLYTIWVGINDIDLTASWNDTDTLDDQLMQQYGNLVASDVKDKVKQPGANMMLMTVPPIDRSPLWLNTSAMDTVKHRVREYNQKLSELAKDKNVMLFDAWSAFTQMLDHPENYGITSTTTYCDWNGPTGCLPIEEYFWYNDLHPTFKIHGILAQFIYEFLATRRR
ncbi:SGNH hydrolase-type esterase domain-containing protein [Syncephalastrum racemosum]|uniref:SGNH hydrolase-type esterase domain-containing protein n=1 Tax=Syncephalastrum racemosum TaxID=13706 RepID=A0A1X2HEA6_SYNRA|nr:SGNH hydrolase-type esterase domain-containing protein [Syncephalastrum racemosum]